MRRSDFIYISGVPKLVITYGQWITECVSSEVVLVIPGNPGLIEYYDKFMANLFEELGGKIPVWGISHGGHSLPEDIKKLPDLKENPALYDLEGQTECKVQFVSRYVPAGCRLHLVGHSIGSQIALQVRRRLAPAAVASSYHLFPTVQRMRQSPAGRRLWLLTRYLRPLVLALAALLALLPSAARRWLVGCWLPADAPAAARDASVALLRPAALGRALAMGHDELLRVDRLDGGLVRDAGRSARFYCSTHDPWVPLEYVERLRRAAPEPDVVVCRRGFPHAFVLSPAAVVGCSRDVADWVKRFSSCFSGEGETKR